MENALIVSRHDSGTRFFTEQLEAASIKRIMILKSCNEARQLLLERSFDLVIVNSPLSDETGEVLARNIAVKGTAQVILVVKAEFYDEMSAVCENDGVLTVSKPLNRGLFWSVLTLAKSAQNRFKRIRDENAKLKQKIDDIRIIDRAKWVLVSCMNMNEQEAHRYIEKQAMDSRSTKRAIAEGVLKNYER
ncbi:MAG: ANTAR domain-containing protein [Oscillospiraceae bacterium]|nr:ANTAR domain-containing protein [Oscillospiraceae bacterium]